MLLSSACSPQIFGLLVHEGFIQFLLALSKSSIIRAQVLDLLVNLVRHGGAGNVLMHGRPPAGPAITLSFVLVAMACALPGCATPNSPR